jgi:Tol biopolymer transport system component
VGGPRAGAWSPDGQWIAFLRSQTGKVQLAKIRPSAGASPEVLANAAPVANGCSMIQWSPTGDRIAFPSADGIAMIAPDGTRLRKLTSRKLHGFAFSRDGAQVYGIFHNISGEGAPC